MEKFVAVCGTNGSVPEVFSKSTEEAVKAVSNNCGNLLFQYAACQLIKSPTKLVGKDISWDPHFINENAGSLVVPSANFLREGFDFSGMVSFLRKIKIPLFFLGLGAQANDLSQTTFDFHPSVFELIEILREQAVGISVRGEFTQRVLQSFGVNHSLVTGCPSNFINPISNFPELISKKYDQPLDCFIYNADEPWPKNPNKKLVEKLIVNWCLSSNGIMVQQAVPQMIQYLRRNNVFSEPKVKSNFEEKLARSLMPDKPINEFQDFINLRTRTYFTVHQWMEDTSKFNFSIGLRLHGNMIAWQSGTPALWIYHDARTQELVETMELPRVSLHNFLDKCKSIEEARDYFNFEPNKYNERRKYLRSQLDKVLEGTNFGQD